MQLSEVSIKRHVLTYMVSFAIILFGIIGASGIGVDRFPDIEFPMISVNTIMVGASPEIIDASVTNIIESAVNTVPGLDDIRGSSSPNVSSVVVMFNSEKNLDVAFNEVQSKVNQVLNKLPAEAERPIISKMEFGATPVVWLALVGDRTLQQLNQYAENVIKKNLENIDGVGEVILGGERARTIRIDLDLQRLANLAITTQDVMRAFQTEHVQMPGGFLGSSGKEHLIRLDLEYHDVEALKQMVVGYRGEHAIRLKDIADVKDHLEDFRALAKFNGKQTVGLGIVKVSGANTVSIANEVQHRLETQILPALPPGLELNIASNDADIIEEIVHALYEHLALGTFLAAFVVFVFLKSLRATAIISLAIPISLLGAVFVIYAFGYTFNMMTLLALLLLIGIVVDDAIVVLENIHRHQEEGETDAMQAAISGTSEVGFAVLAATFTLVAIFAPVIFMEGIMGSFFRAFAVVVTIGVLVSLLVALTLTPMLCARFLKVETEHGAFYSKVEAFFDHMENTYKSLISKSLNHRWLVLLASIIVVALSVPFFMLIDKEFMPPTDEARLTIIYRTPLGSDITYNQSRLESIEAILDAHEDSIASYFSAIGLNNANINGGMLFVRLTPINKRDIHQEELAAQLNKELGQIPGVLAFVSRTSPMGGQRGEPLQFVLRGPNLDKVSELANGLLERLNSTPGMGKVDMDLQLDLPQLIPHIDREKIAGMGLSAKDVASAVNVLAGGLDVAKYNDDPGDGERYDIRIKAKPGSIVDRDDLSNIYLRTNKGQMVRLDTVAHFEEKLGAAVISKYNLLYAATFYSTPELPLAESIKVVDGIANEDFPLGYNIEIIGQAKEFKKSAASMGFVFSLALVLVYMVLASQFNSFSQPIIVMVAQPLAIIGGVFALWITGSSLNIYSMIGLVLLVGLVSKNSILLIDLTNQLRGKGRSIDSALLEACPKRMRPVLMTSLTVILALLPAAMGAGAGSDTNGPLSIAVIGGMLSSTLLTLLVVPVVYSLWQSALEKSAASKKQGPVSSTAATNLGQE